MSVFQVNSQEQQDPLKVKVGKIFISFTNRSGNLYRTHIIEVIITVKQVLPLIIILEK